jgi:hypothetical protein
MAKVFIALMLALISSGGCADDHEIGEAEAITIADRHLARTLPQMPRSMLRPRAVDQGSTWRVDYFPPADSTGGASVGVNKQNGQVVDFVIHQ